MRSILHSLFRDIYLSLSVFFLIIFSIVILASLDRPLFPVYYVYIFVSIFIFWLFSQIDFDVISLFSKHFYIGSIALLILTLIIGSVTRGTVRWIPLGPFSLQPAEIIRPFLLVFFAVYITKGEFNAKKILKLAGLVALPVILILIQPSLGVSILTTVGFFGVLIASKFDKKRLLIGIIGLILMVPLFWSILAPYQKQRVLSFLEPTADPLGAGYNSIQSTIAVGSGRLTGTGLGKGIQTQLEFLPEKQTDFIFAATAEELGMIGASLILFASFIILFRLTNIMENSVSPAGRAYVSGFFLIYLIQIFIHVGMNMGMLPVTGIPFPLLSAGGSSLLATMAGLGIALGAYKR